MAIFRSGVFSLDIRRLIWVRVGHLTLSLGERLVLERSPLLRACASAASVLCHLRAAVGRGSRCTSPRGCARLSQRISLLRSEEHTSELQSLMRISYAVVCLQKKKQ